MRLPATRRLKWISGTAWIVSWFALGLEIFRWHHVTTSLHLTCNCTPPPGIHSHPGTFLLAVLTGSALAPPVFLATTITDWARKRRRIA